MTSNRSGRKVFVISALAAVVFFIVLTVVAERWDAPDPAPAASRPSSGTDTSGPYRDDDLLELIDPLPVPLSNSVRIDTDKTDPQTLAAWMAGCVPSGSSWLINAKDHSVTLYVYRFDFAVAAVAARGDQPDYSGWNDVRAWQQDVQDQATETMRRTGAVASVNVVVLSDAEGSGILLASRNGDPAFDIAGLKG